MCQKQVESEREEAAKVRVGVQMDDGKIIFKFEQ